MQEIINTITVSELWLWVVGVCTGIVAIAKVVEIVKKSGKGDFKKKVTDTEKKLDEAEREITVLKDEVSEMKSAIHVILQAELALTNHAIDGNNIQGLKDMRTKMSDFLIKRS